MASEIADKGQRAAEDDSGVRRRGLLRLGTLVTAITGSSAISTFGTTSAQAAPGDKPAPNTYVPLAEKGAPSGVAVLDGSAKIPSSQLPDLSATYAGKVDGHVASMVVSGGADQGPPLQAAIDSLSAAGGGVITLPSKTINVSSLVMKDGVSLVGAGKYVTTLKPLAGGAAASFITLAAGPVRGWLRNLALIGNGIAGQKGLYLQAVGNGGTPNHGGWWNSGLDNVLVRDFAGDQIWLRGGGADFLKPHQFLTFKDVEAYTTGTAAALRITGQVAQVDVIGHSQFDGPSSSGGTGTNIIVTREVDDALANVSDISPSAIRFGNVTTQDNKRGYTIERSAGVVIEGGWWENLAEGLVADVAAPMVRVKGVYTANVGANAGAGWIMKAAGGALLLASENTFAGTVDKHFINSNGDGIIQQSNITTAGTPVITDGITPNVGVGAGGDVVLGSARDALVSSSATQVTTITSKAGPGERVTLKAWGGSLVLNSTGNINASGLTMPYTVPANAVVTLLKYDLGAVWNIESVSA